MSSTPMNYLLAMAGLAFLLLICRFDLKAQIPGEPVGADSLKTTLFPVAGYDSDIGFLGGLLYNRIDYRGRAEPFYYYINSSLTASTKGMVSLEFEYDRTKSFNSEIRSKYVVYAYRFTHDLYFGIGNDTGFSRELFENDYYFFESLGINVKYDGRLPLNRQGDSRFDLLFGLATRYESPTVRQDSSIFGVDRPRGFYGGWVTSFKTGFVWENRDSEFDPNTGNRLEVNLRAAPGVLFSDFGVAVVRADYRHYFRVLDWLTWANRLQVRHTAGNPPYWELSRLGNEETLRGYPLNRFMGNSSVAYTLELRKWLLRLPEYSIKIGAHLFTDVGRVFTEPDDWGDLFSGYKQTVGVGGALSLFSPDLILRSEAGLSKDILRIYVGIGYSF